MSEFSLESWDGYPLPQARTQIRVADQLIEQLVTRGVDRVFGIPGGAVSPLFDAMIDADIEVVTCQHEGMAMYMAYGYSRATGKPAVVMVTSGPGVLNTVTGAAAAMLDEVPLVILAGEVSTNMAGRGMIQDGGPCGLNIAAVMTPVAKHVETCTRSGRAPAALNQALDTAMTHPRGPVVLTVPVDMSKADTSRCGMVSQTSVLPTADDGVCGRVASGLANAYRPAIFLGLGARIAGVGREVHRLAERARCPVITDIEAKGLFPESHALSLGVFGLGGRGAAEQYMAGGVDFMLTIGARLDDTTTGGFSDLMQPAGNVIQLDHNPSRLRRSMDYDMGVVCDLSSTLRRISAVTRAPSPQLVLSRDEGVRTALGSAPLAMAPGFDHAPHHPAAVIEMLQSVMPPDAVYTTDIGNHLIFAAQGLVLDRPDCFHIALGIGGMGSGVGTAMGLAMHHGKQRTVVGICGDGTMRMVGTELATCAAHGVPVVLAVLNDGQLGMVEHGNQHVFGRSEYCASPSVDLVSFARSLGAEAYRIDRVRDLSRAVKRVGRTPLGLEFPVRAEVRPAGPRAKMFAKKPA